jgi:hypothetical protein
MLFSYWLRLSEFRKDGFGAEAMSDMDLLAFAVIAGGAFIGLRFYRLDRTGGNSPQSVQHGCNMTCRA